MEARKCDICGAYGDHPFFGWYTLEPAVTDYVSIGSFVRTETCSLPCLAKAVATLQTAANSKVAV